MNTQNYPLNLSDRPEFSARFLASLMAAESLTEEAGGTVALLMTQTFRTNLRVAEGAATLVERILVLTNLMNSVPVSSLGSSTVPHRKSVVCKWEVQ